MHLLLELAFFVGYHKVLLNVIYILQFSRPFWMCFFSTDGESRRGFMTEAKKNLALLEAQLQGKSFFGGDSIGFVDIAASNLAHWLGVFEEVCCVAPLLTNEEYPALCQWAKRYVADEAVKECLPKREELVAMYSVPAVKEMLQAMATSQKRHVSSFFI